MSTKPTDGGDAHQPTPTAQRSDGGGPEIPNPMVNRREMLKITGAAAGAAAIGAGTASASTGIGASWSDENWHEYDGDNADVSDRTHGVLDWHEYENDEPSADATNLHLQIQNEGEWFDDHDTVLENHYQDMHTIAHIDARNGITNEWEDGGGQSEGYDAALDAIEDYWAIHHQNDINAGLRVLTNFAHFCDAAQANDDVADALLTLHCGDWSGGDTHVLGVVTADFQTAEFELLNGAMFETRVPHIEFYEPVEDDEAGEKIGETLLSPAVLQDAEGDDWWDTEFTFEDVNDDGDTITTGGSWNLQNLPDYDEDSFPGISGVFEMGYWYQQFSRHQNQAGTVQSNYDTDLVGEIYDALDDGEISPTDVRSSVGTARHMGGTDDAYADSYRISLLMQLGLEQNDLEEIASMTIDYEGGLGVAVDRDSDSGQRNIFPDDFDELEDASGLLYSRTTPEQGIVTGERLATNSIAITQNFDEELVAFDLHSGEELFEIDEGNGSDNGLDISPSGDKLVTCYQSTITMYEFDDGLEVVWENSDFEDRGDYIRFIDDETLLLGTDTSNSSSGVLRGLDPETGSVIWSESDINASRISTIRPLGEDHEYAAVDGAVHDPHDGERLWDFPDDETVEDTAYESKYALLSGPSIYDVEADEIVASVNTGYGGYFNGEWVINGDGDGYYYGYRFDPEEETLEQEWSREDLDGFEANVDIVGFGPNDETFLLYNSSENYLETRTVENGALVDEWDDYDVSHGVVWPPSETVDGGLENPIYYDSAEGEEHQLTNGIVEIVEQTDSDGEEVEQSNTNTPEYDTNDVTEYTETVEKHTTVYEETIVNEYDQGDGGGGDWWPSAPSAPNVDDFGSQLAGIVVIAAIVVSVVWSVVSDAVPFLGN